MDGIFLFSENKVFSIAMLDYQSAYTHWKLKFNLETQNHQIWKEFPFPKQHV